MLTEIVIKQSEIIRIQSEIIDDLFQIVSQHLSAEELESLASVDKIGNVANLIKEVET